MTTQSIKTAISLDRELFAKSETLARELQTTRSGLIAQALEEFIAKRRNRKLLERLNAAYAEEAPPRHPAVRAAHRRAAQGSW